MANTNLAAAGAAKNDEFYTQHHDVEAEMNAYLDYDPGTFRGKTVLLPCDDPEWSSFTRYFAARFRDLGLKRLISTSYAPGSKRYRGHGNRPSSRRAARASARRGRGCRGRSSPSTATPTATGGSTSMTCSGTTSRGPAVRRHREHQRDHVQGGVPADPGEQAVAGGLPLQPGHVLPGARRFPARPYLPVRPGA